jgi:hypothetical protein
VRLALPREQSARLDICDALGRVLCTAADGRYASGASTIVLDVAALPRGCVFLRLRAGSSTVARAVLLR